MTYAELFAEMKNRFTGADVSDIQEHLAFQFNIVGEAEGAFYVEVKNGEQFIEPYEYYDRDAVFYCSAKTLLKLADGKLDPVAAFTLQKIRIEGSIEKALKFKNLIDSRK